MKTRMLLLDYLPCTQLAEQHTLIYVGEDCISSLLQPAIETISVNLGTVEGQARLMDWLRQNEPPDCVKCSLDSAAYDGAASDFLQEKVVGITRILESTLMLNTSIHWEFVIPEGADIWSKACEAYFKTLREGLVTALPQTRVTFFTEPAQSR